MAIMGNRNSSLMSDYPSVFQNKDYQYQGGRLSLKPKLVHGKNLLRKQYETNRKLRNAARSCMDCHENESPSPRNSRQHQLQSSTVEHSNERSYRTNESENFISIRDNADKVSTRAYQIKEVNLIQIHKEPFASGHDRNRVARASSQSLIKPENIGLSRQVNETSRNAIKERESFCID